jgi:drug/metabolite transporter (DMT)-like permease
MLLLGERLVLQQWLAIIIIFIGVYFSREPKVLKDKDIPPAVTG